MNNKRHILPIVYTMLVQIRSVSIIYSELNEAHGSYVSVLK